MKSKLRAVVFLPFFFSLSLASLIVDTITAKAATCEPVLLQWQAGKRNFSIVGPDKVLLETLAVNIPQTSFHWTVNLEAGTVVFARVTDSTGATSFSNPVTIQRGLSNCILASPIQTSASLPSSTESTATATASALITTASTTVLNPETLTASLFSDSAFQPRLSTSKSLSTSNAILSSVPTSSLPSSSSFPVSIPSTMSPHTSSTVSPHASSAAHSSDRRLNVGAIIGILLGILVFLGTLISLVMRRRKRRLQAIRGTRLHDLEDRLTFEVDPLPILPIRIRTMRKPRLLPSPSRTTPQTGAGTSPSVVPPPGTSEQAASVDALNSQIINGLIEQNRELVRLALRGSGLGLQDATPPPAYI
ncbi:hypothetical protein FB45DRAFT_910203 [Roridomyces roridus]|uniref:Mid2 domain-containing protein n=1 Tax=Roridomyces roridus TaxID=1738132 RepID=A0AAD7BZF0_9AGAR|nr:hypothetical protein FB45DRAFT_910203 [Roridomyces roridus]